MHIPDGMLSPGTCLACTTLMLPVWALAAKQTRRELSARQVPQLAAHAALSFTIMLFNVPVLGGTTAHAVGGTLLAIALGPWAAVIGVTVALAIQALFFADGGLLTLGANALAIACVGPFLGYAVFRLLRVVLPKRHQALAAGVAAYLGLNASALLVAFLLGIQPHLAVGSDGKPLYFPFDLSHTLPGLVLPHLLVAGVIEGVVTAAGYQYLAKTHALEAPAKVSRLYRALVGLIILCPLGLLAPGSAWGEWAAEDLKQQVGFVPQGVQQLTPSGQSALADYQLAGMGHTLAYYLCAALGCATILLTVRGIGQALRIHHHDV